MFRILIAVPFLALTLGGCASTRPVLDACHRVELEAAPTWTVSATWSRDQQEVLLVDPGTGELVAYGHDGGRRHGTEISHAAELDMAHPLRLERDGRDYVLIDRNKILTFDRDLEIRRTLTPTEIFTDHGFSGISLNDAVLHRGQIFGYADFIQDSPDDDGDSEAEGTWRRGFVRLDLDKPELDLIFELPIEGDGEYASYYIYGKRPYVNELRGGRTAGVYVLRFTEPWSLHRVERGELQLLSSGSVDSKDEVNGLFAWNGRLYLLVRGREEVEASGEEPTQPVPQVTDERTQTVLLEAMEALKLGRNYWALHEIDPRTGERLRRFELPTRATKLTLVPGEHLWAAIEEPGAPRMAHEAEESETEPTTLMIMPAEEITRGRFTCQPLEPPASSD